MFAAFPLHLKVEDMVMLAQGNAMQQKSHVPGVDILAFNPEHRCVFAVGISIHIYIYISWDNFLACDVEII